MVLFSNRLEVMRVLVSGSSSFYLPDQRAATIHASLLKAQSIPAVPSQDFLNRLAFDNRRN
jgi:hypothetical protein